MGGLLAPVLVVEEPVAVRVGDGGVGAAVGVLVLAFGGDLGALVHLVVHAVAVGVRVGAAVVVGVGGSLSLPAHPGALVVDVLDLVLVLVVTGAAVLVQDAVHVLGLALTGIVLVQDAVGVGVDVCAAVAVDVLALGHLDGALVLVVEHPVLVGVVEAVDEVFGIGREITHPLDLGGEGVDDAGADVVDPALDGDDLGDDLVHLLVGGPGLPGVEADGADQGAPEQEPPHLLHDFLLRSHVSLRSKTRDAYC